MATDKREDVIVDSLVVDGNIINPKGTQEFSSNFGDGVATVFTIPHGLTRINLSAIVKLNSTGEQVNVSAVVDATNVVITFLGAAPTTNEFKVIVK